MLFDIDRSPQIKKEQKEIRISSFNPLPPVIQQPKQNISHELVLSDGELEPDLNDQLSFGERDPLGNPII